MINVFKAQNVNFLSGDEKITRHSGLKNKMFLSSDFFRLTKFREIRSHQRLGEGRRDSITAARYLFVLRVFHAAVIARETRIKRVFEVLSLLEFKGNDIIYLNHFGFTKSRYSRQFRCWKIKYVY